MVASPRLLVSIGVILALVLPAAVSTCVAGQDWPALPVETRTVLLLTGADLGAIDPRGCFRGGGGAHYRRAFDRWLAERDPGREQIWISVGNVVAGVPGSSTASVDEVFETLEKVPYRVIGLGREEIDGVGPLRLWNRLKESEVEVVATNLRVHETGEALFAESLVLETQAGRVAVLGVFRHYPDDVWGSPEVGTVLSVPPGPAVAHAVAAVRDEVDLVLLLSTLPQADLAQLLRSVDGIDLVAASAKALYGTKLTETGPVPIYWLGAWGQVLGQVGLAPGGRITGSEGAVVSYGFPGTERTTQLPGAGTAEGP